MIVAAVAGAGAAYAQAGLQFSIVSDGAGNVVGELGNGGVTLNSDGANYNVPIVPYQSAPGVAMSPQAPAPSASQTPVVVKLPSTAVVETCASSNVYNKKTGRCGDGNMPVKIVMVSQLSNPAAQTPTVACKAPKVPTFYTSSWACLVPPGYKASLGLD